MSRRSQTYSMMPGAYSPYISAPVQAMQHPYGVYLAEGAADWWGYPDTQQNAAPTNWNEGAVTNSGAMAMASDLIKYNDKLGEILRNPTVMINHRTSLLALRNALIKTFPLNVYPL